MTTSTLDVGRDTSGLRRRWTMAFVVGELIGFIPPAVTGATLGAIGVPDLALVVGLTVAGLFEGAAIGIAQSRVLRSYAPTVDPRAWIIATVAASGYAWLVGMGGGALMGSSIAPTWACLTVLVPAWITALLSMGYAQWRVLRRAVAKSGRWVGVNASAWMIGVAIPVVALSSAPNDWPAWTHAVVGVIAAVAMGLTVGALTGRTLERLLRENVAIQPSSHPAI